MTAYALDEDLVAAAAGDGGPQVRVWEPPELAVVLGRSNRAEQEVREAACVADGVPILRRLGGGGAVLLGPGSLVVSLARREERPFGLDRHMARCVGFLAAALQATTGVRCRPRGTGDLCCGDRKVLGSSLFRGKKVLFYQASILVTLDIGLIDRYLLHPTREPEYRGRRPHRDFLTTLAAQGIQVPLPVLQEGIRRELARRVGAVG